MNKWLIAGATAAGLVISSAAMARVDVGISIGVPGVVYPAAPSTWRRPTRVRGAGARLRAAPPVYYRPAPVYVAPPVIYPAPVYYRGGGRYWHDRGGYYRHGDWGTVTATAADPARSQAKATLSSGFSSRAATPLVS